MGPPRAGYPWQVEREGRRGNACCRDCPGLDPQPSSAVAACPQEASGIPTEPLSWQEVPKQKYAWHICYAFLGNMGLINIGGGLALVVLGSRFTAGQLLSQILLLGGMLHPASWALVALTGLEGWGWLGNIGAAAVALVVIALFVRLIWATYCSGQALQRQTRSRLSR